jgi:hypothetical protein
LILILPYFYCPILLVSNFECRDLRHSLQITLIEVPHVTPMAA